MKNAWTIYFNPKCGSCRNALQILKDNGIEPRVVEYLKTPPSLAELKDLADQLGPGWTELVRTKEDEFEELGLELSEKNRGALLKAIVQHPILLQRPVVTDGRRAVVARPPQKVEELLK